MDPQRHAGADDEPEREQANPADEPGKRHDGGRFTVLAGIAWAAAGGAYNERFEMRETRSVLHADP